MCATRIEPPTAAANPIVEERHVGGKREHRHVEARDSLSVTAGNLGVAWRHTVSRSEPSSDVTSAATTVLNITSGLSMRRDDMGAMCSS